MVGHFHAVLRTRGGVARVANAPVALETEHVVLVENFADIPRAFLKVKALVVRQNPSGVLTAVLQVDETVVDFSRDGFVGEDSNYSTHTVNSKKQDTSVCPLLPEEGSPTYVGGGGGSRYELNFQSSCRLPPLRSSFEEHLPSGRGGHQSTLYIFFQFNYPFFSLLSSIFHLIFVRFLSKVEFQIPVICLRLKETQINT